MALGKITFVAAICVAAVLDSNATTPTKTSSTISITLSSVSDQGNTGDRTALSVRVTNSGSDPIWVAKIDNPSYGKIGYEIEIFDESGHAPVEKKYDYEHVSNFNYLIKKGETNTQFFSLSEIYNLERTHAYYLHLSRTFSIQGMDIVIKSNSIRIPSN